MEKIIEIKNLKKFYGHLEALKGLDIEIFKGEIFGFLGPNGAGKTTTLEILEGLRRPTSGEMFFFGKVMHGDVTADVKERIGVVLQETRFLDHLRVREIVELFSSFFKRTLPAVDVIDLVRLREKENSYVENLSGGQRQRLAIAIALVNDPEIVFLDEPTTGLDPQARDSIWTLIDNLKRSNKTVFLTTHYMEEARRLCDRVGIIDHGRIIETGSPRELIERYGGTSEVDFECRPRPSEVFLKAFEKEITDIDDHFRIVTEDLTGTLEDLILWSKRFGLSITNIMLVEPSLEDVFLKLTGRGLRD